MSEQITPEQARQLLEERRRNRDWFMVAPGTDAWNQAWEALERESGDADRAAEHPETGDCWQYMGHVQGGAAVQFRHRRHPATGERRYLTIQLDTPAAHPGAPAEPPARGPAYDLVRAHTPPAGHIMLQSGSRVEFRRYDGDQPFGGEAANPGEIDTL